MSFASYFGIILEFFDSLCGRGEIGIHAALRWLCRKKRGGSSPLVRTSSNLFGIKNRERFCGSQNLANNIKRLREAKGLSQEKLARLADVANNTLIKMESGENQNPTLVTLKKFAKAFGVSVDDLIK